jgi:hypothetical protein
MITLDPERRDVYSVELMQLLREMMEKDGDH